MCSNLAPRNAGPSHQSACALYTPGHRVHFIQAKLGWEPHPASYRSGTLVSVQDDGWITVDVDGEALRFWNHDPEWARSCFAESAGRVGLPGHCMLHAPRPSGRYCLCVSTDGPTPCAGPPPAGAGPLERIRTHGGFLLPGPEVRRILRNSGDQQPKDEG